MCHRGEVMGFLPAIERLWVLFHLVYNPRCGCCRMVCYYSDSHFDHPLMKGRRDLKWFFTESDPRCHSIINHWPSYQKRRHYEELLQHWMFSIMCYSFNLRAANIHGGAIVFCFVVVFFFFRQHWIYNPVFQTTQAGAGGAGSQTLTPDPAETFEEWLKPRGVNSCTQYPPLCTPHPPSSSSATVISHQAQDLQTKS